MSNATVEKNPTKAGRIKRPKDSIARLMDMTCGWSEFLDSHPDTADKVTSEEIGSLYQSVANELENVMDSDDATKNAAVRDFLKRRVLPLLIR